jgi:hypothetical protein
MLGERAPRIDGLAIDLALPLVKRDRLSSADRLDGRRLPPALATEIDTEDMPVVVTARSERVLDGTSSRG